MKAKLDVSDELDSAAVKDLIAIVRSEMYAAFEKVKIDQFFANEPDSKDRIMAKYDDVYGLLRQWMARVCQRLREWADNPGLLDCPNPVRAAHLAHFVQYFVWEDGKVNPNHTWVFVRSAAGQQVTLTQQDSANRPIQGLRRLPQALVQLDTPSSWVRRFVFDKFNNNGLQTLEQCVRHFNSVCASWFKELAKPTGVESQFNADVRVLLLIDIFECMNDLPGELIILDHCLSSSYSLILICCNCFSLVNR
jgi:hypothetical protein